ncbi:MAG TPA: GNAT family N-acetyltransferase [Solirubrobacterales bacterium]|nr:GNAT family N-acetyltransferase [Solirubrobacterales bacterium]
MASGQTRNGVRFDSARLDPVERRFWRECWESVPAEVAAEHGVERRDFGPVQATIVSALAEVPMLNLLLGATEPGAVEGGHLAAAATWARERGTDPYVPVAPETPGTAAAETWLEDNGFRRGYAWMKFVRNAHPPLFREPRGVEVVELEAGSEQPFGTIAAVGFGLPAWAAAFFAGLPGREGWRCYVALVDGEPQGCAAMLIKGEVAEFGIAATLEPARGRGCQLALLRRRILDAGEAGCHTLFVETGERAPDRPSGSYRNLLRAGFEEAYLRPNYQRPPG